MSTAFEHFLCRHFFYFYTLAFTEKIGTGDKSRQMQCGSGILEFCQTFGFPKRDFSQLEKNVYLLAGTQNQDFIFLTSLESNENILPSAPTRTQSKSVELTTVRYSKLPIGGVVNLLLALLQEQPLFAQFSISKCSKVGRNWKTNRSVTITLLTKKSQILVLNRRMNWIVLDTIKNQS